MALIHGRAAKPNSW